MRNLDEAARSLTDWLLEKLPGATDVAVSDLEQPSTGGYSNELLFFTATWTASDGEARHELVARITTPVPSLFPYPSMQREHRLLRALNQTGLPLPRMFWLEEDASVLGAPFVTMERVRGRIAPDNPPYTAEGWVLELSPRDQAKLYDNGLRAIAAVSALDVNAAGLDFLAAPKPGETTSEERVRFVEEYLEWATGGRPFPVLEGALEWVREHCPAEEEPLALSWGDARLGNMVFDENLEMIAALDWEQAALASPELDLGWWLFSRRTHGEGLGLELPPGFPSREQTIARYEEVTGRTAKHVDFYEAYNGLVGSIAVMRIGDTMIEAGALPADSPMPALNPASISLAGMLDLPAPTGEVTSWATSAPTRG
jgi:aminoglycoside phosphotransferase (APT) family kinase protein